MRGERILALDLNRRATEHPAKVRNNPRGWGAPAPRGVAGLLYGTQPFTSPAHCDHDLPILAGIARATEIRDPRNTLRYIGDIALKAVTNLAEDGKRQISFTPLNPSKMASIQSTILGKIVLIKPKGLASDLDPAPEP
jgi:hypothetical protein